MTKVFKKSFMSSNIKILTILLGHPVYHNQLVFFYLSRQKIYIELKGWIRPYYQSSKFKLLNLFLVSLIETQRLPIQLPVY